MMPRRTWTLGVLVLVFGCAPQRIAARNGYIALYKGGGITAEELEGWLAAQGRAEADPAEIERLVLTKVLAGEMAQAAPSARVRAAFLELETRVLANVFRQHVVAGVEVTSEEIGRALELRSRARPQKKRLWNLFKRVPATAGPEERLAVRVETEGLRARLTAGADFAGLARTESDSQTRFRGGLIGNVDPDEMAAGVRDVAAGLTAGELSPVIETAEGFTILFCEKVLPGGEIPAAKRRQAVEQRLRWERMSAEWTALEAEGRRLLELDSVAIAGSSEGIAVRVGEHGTLTLAELRAWAELSGLGSDLSTVGLEILAGGLATQVLAAARSRELGLDRAPGISATLFWGRQRILAAEALRRRAAAATSPLPEAEAREYFEANRERFREPEAFRVTAIGILAEREGLRERYAAAQAVADALAAGRLSFTEAAARHSGLASAASGGELGWLTRQELAAMGPRVLAAVVAMAPGGISRLVQQPRGPLDPGGMLWIFQLEEHRPGAAMGYREAREAVVADLTRQRRRDAEAVIRARLLGDLAVRSSERPVNRRNR